MRRQFLKASLALAAATLVGCEKKPEEPAAPPAPPPPPPPQEPASSSADASEHIDWIAVDTPENVPAKVKVSLVTDKGEIVLSLNGKAAPITVNNFLRYLDSGKLPGSEFWRAAHAGPDGFVQATMRGPTFPPIPHEPTSQTGLSHTDGAISMSRFAPGTATADFVICVGDETRMDAGREGSDDKLGYAVFGHVIKGMGVVRAIMNGKIDKHTREGGWAGQMLATPVKIISAKRLS